MREEARIYSNSEGGGKSWELLLDHLRSVPELYKQLLEQIEQDEKKTEEGNE